MNCAGSRVLAVSVLLFVFLICPVVCLGQRITVIDPSAPSSKSIEDISTAALKGSQPRADPPQLLETADKKEFTREFVAVQWRPGDRIYLFVVRPVYPFAQAP